MEKQSPKGSAAAPSKKRRWSDADQLTRCENDPAFDVTTAVGKGSPAISKARSSASSTSASTSSSPQNSANNKKRRNDHTSAVDRDAGQEQRQLLLPQRRGLPIWEGAATCTRCLCCGAPLYLKVHQLTTREHTLYGHSPAAFDRGGAQQPCRHHRRRDRKRKNHPYARANPTLSPFSVVDCPNLWLGLMV